MHQPGKTNFILSVLLTGTLLAGLCAPAQAQFVSPWFRGGKQVWQALLAKAKLPTNGQALQLRPLSNAATGYAVKTTAANWLRHRVGHSGVFSRMEKEALLQKTNNPKLQLGKVAYFHDRDARLFNWVSSQPGAHAEEAAFWRHQNILSNTLAELETFYQGELPEAFSSGLFSKEQVARLLQDPVQPPAFVLYPKEIEHFAALHTLAEQKAWAQQTLSRIRADLNTLLGKDPTRLQNNEFERYYVQKLRLIYFTTLQEVLAGAKEKRPSLIMRRKRALKANLPGDDCPMTDAQRLGFWRYHLDKLASAQPLLSQSGDHFAQYTQLKSLLSRLAPVYEPYAVAEAFSVPYEQSLRLGTLWPDIIVGPQEGLQLRKMTAQESERQLPAKIRALNQQLADLRTQTPEDLSFYTRYYRLEKQKALYESFLIRHRLISRGHHP